MNLHSYTLFDRIINCPHINSNVCSSVCSCQNHLPIRQVPEPWNGDIDNSSFLIIGSNPALVDNEMYPSKDINWINWVNLGAGLWDDKSAASFFEGRFGKSVCTLNGQPYVDVVNSTVLKQINSNITACRFQNGYWNTYNELCKAISTRFTPWEFVVTDIVHCKSSQQLGVRSAKKQCSNYLKEIISVFANNGADEHHILFIGSDKPENNIKLLESFGWSLTNKTSIGNSSKGDPINQYDMNVSGINIKVYHRIPAPSGANRSCSPINFNGKVVKW